MRTAVGLGVLLLTGCSVYDASRLEPAPGDRTSIRASSTQSDAAGSDGSMQPMPAAVIGSESELPVQTRCGDGIISGPEKCDLGIERDAPGACPTSCPSLTPCAPRALNGTACQAECVLVAPSCKNDDGCCSGSCTAANDNDCSASCGNGLVEPANNETCETTGEHACITDEAACDDGDACTMDQLLGSVSNCNTECVSAPVTTLEADGCCPSGANANDDEDCQPICGNGVRERGEDCDGAMGCTTDCRVTLQPEQLACMEAFGKDECGRCTCLQCTSELLACSQGPDATQNQLCNAVIDCSRREQCVGTPCYCGNPPVCGVPRGPCQTEIEAAAGSVDPWVITLLRADPTTTLGKASAASACRALHCSDVCGAQQPAQPAD